MDTSIVTNQDIKFEARKSVIFKWHQRWDISETVRFLYTFKPLVDCKLYLDLPPKDLFPIILHLWSRGQISNFEFCCTPQEEKVGYYIQSGTCLGASETHVLLSFLRSGFCKWPVITVTPQTLKIALHKIQD